MREGWGIKNVPFFGCIWKMVTRSFQVYSQLELKGILLLHAFNFHYYTLKLRVTTFQMEYSMDIKYICLQILLPKCPCPWKSMYSELSSRSIPRWQQLNILLTFEWISKWATSGASLSWITTQLFGLYLNMAINLLLLQNKWFWLEVCGYLNWVDFDFFSDIVFWVFVCAHGRSAVAVENCIALLRAVVQYFVFLPSGNSL